MQFFVGPPNQENKTKMLQRAQYFVMVGKVQQSSKFRFLTNDKEIFKSIKKAIDQILTLCWHSIYKFFLCFCCIL